MNLVHKKFKDLPIGTVFTHDSSSYGNKRRWYKIVENGSRRCDEQGNFIDDTPYYYTTGENIDCYIHGE